MPKTTEVHKPLLASDPKASASANANAKAKAKAKAKTETKTKAKGKSKSKDPLAVTDDGVTKSKKSTVNEIAFRGACARQVRMLLPGSTVRTTEAAKLLINQLEITLVRMLTRGSLEVMHDKMQNTLNESFAEAAIHAIMTPRMAARAIRRGKDAIKALEELNGSDDLFEV